MLADAGRGSDHARALQVEDRQSRWPRRGTSPLQRALGRRAPAKPLTAELEVALQRLRETSLLQRVRAHCRLEDEPAAMTSIACTLDIDEAEATA